MAPRLELFFDYSSPFGYLATTQVERVAEAHGAELEWKPFLLGALFKAIGTPMIPLHAMPEPKRRHQELDIQRWAEHWGVPLRWPSRFPLRTVAPLRLTLLAPAPSRAALIHRLMRACWVDDADPEDTEVLRRCARDAGVDEGLVDRRGEPHIKEMLRNLTDEAIQRGVPGVPTFFVDGNLMFWGQDRIAFVEAALGGWRPAADARERT